VHILSQACPSVLPDKQSVMSRAVTVWFSRDSCDVYTGFFRSIREPYCFSWRRPIYQCM